MIVQITWSHVGLQIEDIGRDDANWTDVGPYPAIRQLGYQCPLFARKFRWDATDVIMEVGDPCLPSSHSSWCHPLP